jgi:polyisoprenoid-binding protein YceI
MTTPGATPSKLSELTGNYLLDATDSKLGFVVPTMVVATVRGQFDEFEGTAQLDGADPSRSVVQVIIQADSIQTFNKQRDDHLRRSFLETTAHPTITFASTRVERRERMRYDVTGDLTIRGITKPVTVPFELTRADDRLRFTGSLTISRKDWGVRWITIGELGGVFIGDRVTLELDVTAVKQ